MPILDAHPSGRHFLQIPGPSPVPDRILRAMSLPTIDHRGPEFAALGLRVFKGLGQIFQTRHPVVIYPASGTGAWEAALANVMSPGDAVLMFETGHFASLWQKMAVRLGLAPEFLAMPGVDAATGCRVRNTCFRPASTSVCSPSLPAIFAHSDAKWPVSTISTWSPGLVVLASAASQAPVPEAG